MRYPRLDHRFVEHVPDRLEPGVLYVSIKYATATHQCCCGCGNEVVTPITPTDWSLTFDGESISLSPSIGSWTLPCRSHYFIKKGRVIEAPPWSDDQVTAERARDRRAKARHYLPQPEAVPSSGKPGLPEAQAQPLRLWHKIKRWLTRGA
jgi:hypothetical protein